MFAKQNAQSSNPKVRLLAAEKRVTSAEIAVERAQKDLDRAHENAKKVKLEAPARVCQVWAWSHTIKWLCEQNYIYLTLDHQSGLSFLRVSQRSNSQPRCLYCSHPHTHSAQRMSASTDNIPVFIVVLLRNTSLNSSLLHCTTHVCSKVNKVHRSHHCK